MYAASQADKLDRLRRRQVDSLRLYNERVTETATDSSESSGRSEYRVDFLALGRPASLYVRLGPEFPVDKPTIRVEPVLAHPWVSAAGEIIGAPGLLKFSVHSELGRVVQAIVRELEERAGPSEEAVSVAAETAAAAANGGTPVSAALAGLSISRLRELGTDSDKLDGFVATLPASITLSNAVSDMVAKVESQAMENLSRESELKQLRSEVAELGATLSASAEEHEFNRKRYAELCARYEPQAIRSALTASVVVIDEESEHVAESFLAGNIDLEAFLADYTQRRALSYSRKFRADNLGHQLDKLHEAGF